VLITAALLGPLVLALVSVFWGIVLLYNMKIKNYGFAGNLTMAV
jgi:geranylgeranylglycerol-phosphate geranylgeranyltransferase